MKGKDAKSHYASIYLTSAVRQHLYEIVEVLKKTHNRRWSAAKVVNLALHAWTIMIGKMDDAEIDRLFNEYDNI